MRTTLTLLVFLICTFYGTAQQTGDLTRLTRLDQIQYFETGTTAPLSTAQVSNSQVYILQQGAFNTVTVNTQGTGVDISIQQNGDRNNVNLRSENVPLTESILQNGNNNTVLSYYFGYNDPVNSEVIQTGNNLTLEKYGVNSYTDRIQVNMQGDSRTVIIRSY